MSVSTWNEPTDAGEVTVIEISLARIRVQLLSLGAAIREVYVPDRDGNLGGVHLSLPTVADHAVHALNPHLGGTLGRYANRIAGGTFTLDGNRYLLDVNNGPNTLHGGAHGWDRLIWRVDDITDDRDAVTVTFTLTSPDGDMGFPGRMDARTTYVVSNARIAMHYVATADAPTVISMANHGYWNLAGSRSIADHDLRVPASRRLLTDATQIPCGVADVVDTAYDLNSPELLGPVLDATGGLDDCYLLEGDGLQVGAELRHAGSGRIMRVLTDAPGMQVYSGNNLKPPFEVHQSMSLEAQRFPDAPNQPSLGPCVLRPGEEYAATTVLEFDVH
ncbi:MAG: aldose epimerase family protein [Actinomycetota bacterium]